MDQGCSQPLPVSRNLIPGVSPQPESATITPNVCSNSRTGLRGKVERRKQRKRRRVFFSSVTGSFFKNNRLRFGDTFAGSERLTSSGCLAFFLFRG